VITYTTFQDVIEHGMDYLGSNSSKQARRDCIRAALEALKDLANAFNWSCVGLVATQRFSKSF
jgi:hypothetical protein